MDVHRATGVRASRVLVTLSGKGASSWQVLMFMRRSSIGRTCLCMRHPPQNLNRTGVAVDVICTRR
jgi:hypothetical protein